MTKKTRKDNQVPNYEVASDVTDNVQTLDKNGRLVSKNEANAARLADNTEEENVYYNEVKFTPQPASQNDATSPAATHNQVDKKKTDRTAQHGNAPQAAPRVGKAGKESDGKTKGVPMALSSSPAASAAKGGSQQTDEPTCTSINDVTLIDNDIYNS